MAVIVRVRACAWYIIAVVFYLTCYLMTKPYQDWSQITGSIHDNEEEIFKDDNIRDILWRNVRHRRTKHGLWLTHIEDFFRELAQPQVRCKKLLQLGGNPCKGHIHGAKNLCLDDYMGMRPNDCTVYSFGIMEDVYFEDMMSDYGCEVFMFDPNIEEENINSTLNINQKFYPYGLDITNKMDILDVDFQNGTHNFIKRQRIPYDELRKKINHKNKLVHYLKLDIEGSEWNVLEYMLENNLLEDVLQIAIEVHATPLVHLKPEGKNNEDQTDTHANCSIAHDDKLASSPWVLDHIQEYWRILSKLQKQGFQRAYYKEHMDHSHDNIFDHNKSVSTCGDLLYIRTRTPPSELKL